MGWYNILSIKPKDLTRSLKHFYKENPQYNFQND